MTSLGRGLTLDVIAETVLGIVVAHFDAAGVDLPERRYVAAGDPSAIAWDCDQLCVALRGIGWGPAEDSAPSSPQVGAGLSAMGVRHAVLSIQLVRCTPSSGERGTGIPSAEVVHAAGLQFARDGGLLSQALVTACSRTGGLVGPGGAATVQAGALTPLGPEGGKHAWDAALAITAMDLA